MFDKLFEFEEELAAYTGAPYVVVTDGCTHAIELCMRYFDIVACGFPARTYISIPMLMKQLDIKYWLTDEEWIGEYQFESTNIWDSARRLEHDMYRKGQMQCLSFGNGKPLDIGKVGAILLDNPLAYEQLSKARSDGRDLRISPWETQTSFFQGYHYCPTLEDCDLGIRMLEITDEKPKYHQYPDLRTIDFNQ